MKKIIIILLANFILFLQGCTDIVESKSSSTIGESSSKIEEVGSSSNVIDPDFEHYGLPVITIQLSTTNISESGLYTSKEEVATYIYTYSTLPKNYVKKSDHNKSDYTKENKLSCGGDTFQNREGLLPKANLRTYIECDIDYRGGSRNAKRIVYSNDFLVFYTSDHYKSFSVFQFVA